jgi:polysaccharide export outer membrane protein
MRLKMAALISIAAFGSVAGWAAPQAPPAQASAQASDTQPGANLSFEPVGPGDLLFIYVLNSVENSRTLRVSGDGTISLPSLKDPIQVAGLLSTEIEKVLVAALTANKILVEPIVSASVVEYRSKPVTVVGAVHTPTTMQAIGSIRLLDAIARADGLTPEAGSEIIVSRPGINGSSESVQHIPVMALMNRLDPSLNLRLLGGEEIRVPNAGKFFVVGNVKAPGSYSITEGEGTTVLKALALCQGTLSFTQPDAFVYRTNPAANHRQEISVPLKQIMKRQSADFHLEPDDILYVPDSPGKRLTATVLARIAGVGSATATGLLIYANR